MISLQRGLKFEVTPLPEILGRTPQSKYSVTNCS